MWSLTIAIVTFIASNSTVGMVPGQVTYRVQTEAQCQQIYRAYQVTPLNNAWVLKMSECERETDGRER